MQDHLPPSVLVVEDDRDILRLLITILKRLPVRVSAAQNAEEALQIFEAMPSPPDLLVTDVIMPGLSGPALAEQILRTSPEVRVLFLSGFDNKLIARKFVVDERFPFLPKPFTFESLGAKVMEILSGGQQHLQLLG